MEKITSRENERVKYACRLAGSAAFREEEGLFLAEGRRLCMDIALRQPPAMVFLTEKLLQSCPEAASLSPNTLLVSGPVAEKLSETRTNQGLFCLFALPRNALEDISLDEGALLCQQVQDPSNIGAMLRSAAAFGFGGVVLTPGCADPFAPKALRASMGAAMRLPLAREVQLADALAFFKRKGAAVYAAALTENALPLAEVPVRRPFALMVGNEGAGLTDEAVAAAHTTVCIPMRRGVESLNAAVAASVLMFHFSSNQGVPACSGMTKRTRGERP